MRRHVDRSEMMLHEYKTTLRAPWNLVTSGASKTSRCLLQDENPLLPQIPDTYPPVSTRGQLTKAALGFWSASMLLWADGAGIWGPQSRIARSASYIPGSAPSFSTSWLVLGKEMLCNWVVSISMRDAERHRDEVFFFFQTALTWHVCRMILHFLKSQTADVMDCTMMYHRCINTLAHMWLSVPSGTFLEWDPLHVLVGGSRMGG